MVFGSERMLSRLAHGMNRAASEGPQARTHTFGNAIENVLVADWPIGAGVLVLYSTHLPLHPRRPHCWPNDSRARPTLLARATNGCVSAGPENAANIPLHRRN
jgi:hypothetical protein